MLEQSVIYQDILQRGVQKGEAQGFQKGELKFLLTMLEYRVGKLPRGLQKQIEELPGKQAEALGKASYTFSSKDDLRNWLKQHAATR